MTFAVTIERGPKKGTVLSARQSEVYLRRCPPERPCSDEQVAQVRAFFDGEPSPLPERPVGPDFDLAAWVNSNGAGCCGNGATAKAKPARKAPVLVEPCPPLALTPTRPRAVVTVAAGVAGRRLLAVTGPLMRAYAERLDADFVVLDWVGNKHWPVSSKYAIPRAVELYDRVVYADADVLFRPGCLDLFAACPPGYFGARLEIGCHLRRDGGKWLRRDYAAACRSAVPENYFNAGVMVLERQHAPLLEPPTTPIQPLWCAEQHATARAVDAAGVPFHGLPRACNWMPWADGNAEPPADAVLHFTGYAGHARRLAALRAEAAKWTTVSLV